MNENTNVQQLKGLWIKTLLGFALKFYDPPSLLVDLFKYWNIFFNHLKNPNFKRPVKTMLCLQVMKEVRNGFI